jgi:hypothetical protein
MATYALPEQTRGRSRMILGFETRSNTSFHGQYKELGCSFPLQTTEYNTAMERGTVDGLTSSIYIGMAYGPKRE